MHKTTSHGCIHPWLHLFVVVMTIAPTSFHSARAQAAQAPVSPFANLPKISQVSLSPDGSKLLILRAVGETYHATSYEIAAKKNRMVIAADPEQFLLNWCRWATNVRIVCSIRYYGTLQAAQLSRRSAARYRDGRVTFTRLIAADYDGSNVQQLVDTERASQSSKPGVVWNPPLQDQVISWIPDDDDHILMQLNRDDRAHPSVYRLNINNNRMSRARRHHESVFRWYADRHGEVRLGLGYRDQKPVLYATEGNGVRELDISRLVGIYPPEPLGFTADDKYVYLASPSGGNRYGIVRVNLADPEDVQSVFSDTDFDVLGGLELHRVTGEPIYLRYDRDLPAYHWFNDGFRKRFEAVSRSIPAAVEEIVSASDDSRKFVVHAEGGVSPSFYLYDEQAKTLVQIGRDYPDIRNESIVDLKPIQYPARDGMPIPAYFATPAGIEAKNLATVILPHGGPYARDTAKFDYWVQYLLSRGYAVLKPNYRGSAGYGQAFLGAGIRQWGMAMQDDVIDGLDWMIEQGITDPERVCIVGGSYGGYVALVAAYKTPERFRCAVSFAGITDLPAVNQRFLRFNFGALRFAGVQQGDAATANSPIHHVKDIAVPLLIVHGDVDRNVMIEQSRSFVEALVESGKPHRYLEQTNGDHHLSVQSHRLEFFEAMDTFLREHLGDGASLGP